VLTVALGLEASIDISVAGQIPARPPLSWLVPATDAVVLQASPHGSGYPNARVCNNRTPACSCQPCGWPDKPGHGAFPFALEFGCTCRFGASTSMISMAGERERVGLAGAVCLDEAPSLIGWSGPAPLLKTGTSRTPEDTNFLAFVLFLC